MIEQNFLSSRKEKLMTKEIDKSLISKILSLPEAPILIEELQARLKEEKKRRQEFYNLLTTEENKTEFINGEIIIQSPVKKHHNTYSGLLYQLLNIYVTKHDLGFVGIEKIMVSLTRNDYEPDVCVFLKEKADGFSEDQALFPAPDLVIEFTSKKTESRDRGIKFEDYENHGVKEYWIISPVSKTVEQYHLENGSYQLIKKSNSGDIESYAILGFNIPIQAIFDKDSNLKVISDILR